MRNQTLNERWENKWKNFLNEYKKVSYKNKPENLVFIRFGKFGKSSKISLDQDMLDDIGSGGHEAGVSVFFALPYNDKFVLIEPDEGRSLYGLDNYFDNMFSNVLNTKEIYLVDGDLIRTPNRDEKSFYILQDEIKEYKVELDYLDQDLEDGNITKVEYENRKEEYLKLIEQAKYNSEWTYEVGVDGEPVLINVKIVKQLNIDDILLDERTGYSLSDFLKELGTLNK